MNKLLENKNILIAVTGSIAVYKSLELVRLYKKSGANVRVIMTQSAKKFVTPLTFETLSQNSVLDDSNEDWSTDTVNNHIAIGKWADLFVIAPVTANTINKISNGIADNILTQAVLAYPEVKLISPAANTNMIQNPITKKSLKKLRSNNFKIVNTQVKELACKDIGDGAMAEPMDIFHASCKELLRQEYWENRKVILNGGGTIEKIDDVRFISNFSSGKMAASLATALYYKGADVSLISSKNIEIPKGIKKIDAFSTLGMKKRIEKELRNKSSKKTYFFSVAAVSDYVPKDPRSGKIKKVNVGKEWELSLTQNIDILDSLDKTDIYAIGFKAEMDKENAKHNAIAMLKKKKLDGVCLNILGDDNKFGGDTNSIEFITDNDSFILPQANKLELSLQLLDTLKEKFAK